MTMETLLPFIRAAVGLVALAQALGRPSTDSACECRGAVVTLSHHEQYREPAALVRTPLGNS